MKNQFKWKSSRYIGTISLCIFVSVSVGVLFSSYYMNMAVKEEENAESRRMEYRQLGENLANASDYLTSEVRYFAVTGEIQHLYNYWYEIYETRQRDYAITIFESSNPPVEEQELLERAKQYSDLLVETETLSMKMVLLSINKTQQDYGEDEKLQQYLSYVLEYPLPEKYESLNSAQLRQEAVSILYDENYEDYKEKIMTPIDEFQNLMNERLDNEVKTKRQKTRIGTIIQVAIAMVTLGAIGFLVYIMNKLYIKPLKSYTREISNTGFQKKDNGEAKIVPDGADELVQFADTYNQMIDMFFTELHQRKNAEESMKKARNEAESANQSKSIFLAQMSHELRTPLNAVNGYIYLLERTNLNFRQQEYVENIRKSAKGLLELINQILDFSKIDMNHLVLEEIPFSLKELAEEVKQVLSVQAEEKGLYLRLQVDPKIPDILLGDPLRLRQVLINLIGNAIKFTEKGGVDIKISLCTSAADKKCNVFFRIKDSGIGISEEAKKKIFQPFTQSDASITRKYGGTGLGLPISSQLVALSGDKTHRLKVESEVGKGSVFSFEMDYKIAKEMESVNRKSETGLPDCRNKKVLLVDDNEVNIQVQGEILRLTGAQVFTGKSGKEALQLLGERKDIQLIFMDIRMPELDGFQTTRLLRDMEGYQKVPVIALTADAMEEVKEKVKEAGMNGCILKPVQQEVLFDTLKKYLHVGEQKEAVSATINIKQITEKEEEKPTFFQEKKCLEHLSGNEKSLLQIMHTFLELHKEDDRKLVNLVKQNQWKEAEELLHLLKGVTGNLCCYPLAEKCDSFRKEIKNGYQKEVGEQESFLSIWNSTIQEVEKVYQRRKAQEGTGDILRKDKISEKISMEELEKTVTKLYWLCEDYDTEVVSLLEKNEKQLEQFVDKEIMDALRKSSMRYDFKEMKKSLQKIKERWEAE